MNVSIIKTIDRQVGTPLSLLLSLFKKPRHIHSSKKILFVQLWGIGETICTLPAMKATRKKFPESHIAVLATARDRVVYETCSYVDAILELELNVIDILKFIGKHLKEYDIVIDMEEYLNISALISYFVGNFRVGYAQQIRSRLYDKSVMYNDKQHVVMTFLDLVAQIGVKTEVRRLEKLAVDKKTKQSVKKILSLHKISKNDFLVGIGAGAAESSQCRKWLKDRFAKLVDLLVEKYKAKIIFIGSDKEVEEFDDIIHLMKNEKNRAVNLAGKTTQMCLFALTEHFNLFIGNDSGPMHIAAAQGVRTIGLFGPNLPCRFGPFGKQNRTLYKGQICGYSPCVNVHLGQVPDCLYAKQSEDYQKCMKAITVQDVFKVVWGVLHEEEDRTDD